MKSIQIIYKRNGENVGTIVPFCPVNDSINLEEEKAYCIHWDNDMLVTAKVYEVRTIIIPDWMTAKDYCDNWIEYKYTYGLGADETWNAQWIKKLCILEGAKRYAAIKLLKTKKFRSSYRENICRGLIEWLNGQREIGENGLVIPVSEYDYREYKYIANQLYYS